MSAPERVVVLCGGKGTRLGEMTAATPKPLVEVGGRPILEHILTSYMRRGRREFVLCTGYRGEDIEAFVADRGFDADIRISDAGVDAGILRRIWAAREMMGERAIVTYGDTFVDVDPADILAGHARGGVPLTICTAEIRSPFGIVEAGPDGLVEYFREKPVHSYYIGLMVVERQLLDTLERGLLDAPDGEGLVRLFQELIERRELGVYRSEGLQITFNTPDEHRVAERELARFFTEQEGWEWES